MKLHEAALARAAVAGWLLIAGPALAEDAPPPRPNRQEFCKANPETCAQMKQKRAERQEFCKQNPQKCEEQRARMKQHRAEMKAKCEADPARCEQIKQEHRERFQKRHGSGQPPSEGAKPPPE